MVMFCIFEPQKIQVKYTVSELFESTFQQPDFRTPLADRVRPKKLEDVIGQDHLIGENGPFHIFFESGDFPSILLWGPPGVGKTTLASLLALKGNYSFTRLSAIEAGVKDVREVIAKAEFLKHDGRKTLLFIDEIHRFNKSQQDALLHAVEKGTITLFGATTENPSFEVNSALLSRCQVYRLHSLSAEHLRKVADQALANDSILSKQNIEIEDWEFLISLSGGDARTLLNALELGVRMGEKNAEKVIVRRQHLERALQQKTAQYDKKGESHYDTISAFIKSMRGSDPDAAIFWMAKMIDAGEDARFIARRMVIFASEDIGNADPFALTLAISAFQAVELIGMPEARINLAQACTYLASCPKSNASYSAIDSALEAIRSGADVSVPLHLRNAPTALMKAEGYGESYQYPHNHDEHFVNENYFPARFPPTVFYQPTEYGREKIFKERLTYLWKNRYK